MTLKVRLTDRCSNKRYVLVHENAYPDARARMAIVLIEKWGMVAAVEDGEDSAGRAKMRLSTVSEIVQRACDTADAAMAEFHARGWMVEGPTIDELLREDSE